MKTLLSQFFDTSELEEKPKREISHVVEILPHHAWCCTFRGAQHVVVELTRVGGDWKGDNDLKTVDHVREKGFYSLDAPICEGEQYPYYFILSRTCISERRARQIASAFHREREVMGL